MVDLVKIRKKAKKVAEKVVEAVSSGAAADPAPEKPATESVAAPPVAAPPVAAPPEPPPAPTADKLAKFKEDAGKRRDTAQLEVTADTEQRLEVLTFVLAGEHYAVDIERIVEIVTPRPITRVPNADAAVVGIISLRGTIVTLVDVRSKLRHGAPAGDPAERRIIVVDHQSETIGFEVDRVLRVVKMNAAEVEPHPVVHASEVDDAIRGVFRHANALTILLDFDKLLGHGA